MLTSSFDTTSWDSACTVPQVQDNSAESQESVETGSNSEAKINSVLSSTSAVNVQFYEVSTSKEKKKTYQSQTSYMVCHLMCHPRCKEYWIIRHNVKNTWTGTTRGVRQAASSQIGWNSVEIFYTLETNGVYRTRGIITVVPNGRDELGISDRYM